MQSSPGTAVASRTAPESGVAILRWLLPAGVVVLAAATLAACLAAVVRMDGHPLLYILGLVVLGRAPAAVRFLRTPRPVVPWRAAVAAGLCCLAMVRAVWTGASAWTAPTEALHDWHEPAFRLVVSALLLVAAAHVAFSGRRQVASAPRRWSGQEPPERGGDVDGDHPGRGEARAGRGR